MEMFSFKEDLLLLEVIHFTNLTQHKMQNNNACLRIEIASVVDQVLCSPERQSVCWNPRPNSHWIQQESI